MMRFASQKLVLVPCSVGSMAVRANRKAGREELSHELGTLTTEDELGVGRCERGSELSEQPSCLLVPR